MYYLHKLKFWDTDVLKFANVNTRMSAFLKMIPEALHCEAGPSSDAASPQITVYDLVHAMHSWKRQILLHKTFYESVAPTPAAPIVAMSAGALAGEALSVEDLCAKMFLTDRRFVGVVDTGRVRLWVRNGLLGRGVRDVAPVVAAAARRAAEAGLVEFVTSPEASQEAPSRGSKRSQRDIDGADACEGRAKGRPVMKIKKRSWADIQGNQSAKDRAAALGLNADFFHG